MTVIILQKYIRDLAWQKVRKERFLATKKLSPLVNRVITMFRY